MYALKYVRVYVCLSWLNYLVRTSKSNKKVVEIENSVDKYNNILSMCV